MQVNLLMFGVFKKARYRLWKNSVKFNLRNKRYLSTFELFLFEKHRLFLTRWVIK